MISDTDPVMQKKFAAMMKQKSGEQRLKMGFSMFDSAMRLVLASILTNETADSIRNLIFLRFYGGDFSHDRRKKIIHYLQGYIYPERDLPRDTGHLIAVTRDKILSQSDPKCIILYGSWAKGTANEDSDIDLFIAFEKLDDKTRKCVNEIVYDIEADRHVTILFASAEDFAAEKLPIFTAVKRDGKIVFGDADMSVNPVLPHVKYAGFFRQSRDFESKKVEMAKMLLDKSLYSGIPVHCFVASKHAVQAALAMRGKGYSGKMPTLLPLTRETFGKEIASCLKTLFNIYVRTEYELGAIGKDEAVFAIECTESVIRVYDNFGSINNDVQRT